METDEQSGWSAELPPVNFGRHAVARTCRSQRDDAEVTSAAAERCPVPERQLAHFPSVRPSVRQLLLLLLLPRPPSAKMLMLSAGCRHSARTHQSATPANTMMISHRDDHRRSVQLTSRGHLTSSLVFGDSFMTRVKMISHRTSRILNLNRTE